MPVLVHLAREGRYVDSRVIVADCPPEAAFDPIACIGGEKGWYAFDTLWDIRGFSTSFWAAPATVEVVATSTRSSRAITLSGGEWSAWKRRAC